MSIYDDDGFDEEAAELSEAITGSYTASGGGQETGFSFSDDSNDSSGNVFRDGVIQRQQLPTFDRSNKAYQDFLTNTGRSATNPYGDRGLFAGVFGANKIDYTGILGADQIQKLNDMAYQRFTSPNQPVSGKFGSLFGGATGEETIAGARRPIQQDRGIGGTLAGLAAGAMIPGAGFLSQAATTDYTAGPLPEGYREVDREGLLGGVLAGLEGITGAAPIEKIGETASDLVDRARAGIGAFLPQEQQQNIQEQMISVPSPSPREKDAMSQSMEQQVNNPLVAAIMQGVEDAESRPATIPGIGNSTATANTFGVSDTGQVYKVSPTGVKTYQGVKDYAGTQYGSVRDESSGIMDMLNSLGMAVKPYFNLNPNRKR